MTEEAFRFVVDDADRAGMPLQVAEYVRRASLAQEAIIDRLVLRGCGICGKPATRLILRHGLTEDVTWAACDGLHLNDRPRHELVEVVSLDGYRVQLRERAFSVTNPANPCYVADRCTMDPRCAQHDTCRRAEAA